MLNALLNKKDVLKKVLAHRLKSWSSMKCGIQTFPPEVLKQVVDQNPQEYETWGPFPGSQAEADIMASHRSGGPPRIPETGRSTKADLPVPGIRDTRGGASAGPPRNAPRNAGGASASQGIGVVPMSLKDRLHAHKQAPDISQMSLKDRLNARQQAQVEKDNKEKQDFVSGSSGGEGLSARLAGGAARQPPSESGASGDPPSGAKASAAAGSSSLGTSSSSSSSLKPATTYHPPKTNYVLNNSFVPGGRPPPTTSTSQLPASAVPVSTAPNVHPSSSLKRSASVGSSKSTRAKRLKRNDSAISQKDEPMPQAGLQAGPTNKSVCKTPAVSPNPRPASSRGGGTSQRKR